MNDARVPADGERDFIPVQTRLIKGPYNMPRLAREVAVPSPMMRWVQEADIHEFKGGFDPSRDPLVGPWLGSGDTGWVIVRKDDRRCVHR